MTSARQPDPATSGSPSTGEPEYLVVGVLRHAHGPDGVIVMETVTDFPERIKTGTEVFVGDSHRSMTVSSRRPCMSGLLIKFRGIKTREAAAQLRNESVYVRTADRPPLPGGVFYHHELLGFQIVDEGDATIGTLTEILRTGANDVYVVTRENGDEVLLPVIPSVILSIEKERRIIQIRALPGLLDRPQTRDRANNT